MSIEAVLKDRKIALAEGGLIAKCQDIIHEFDLDAEALADGLEAFANSSAVTANHIAKVRAEMAKKFGGRAGGGGGAGGGGRQTSPQGAGQQQQHAGFKRPAASMAGGPGDTTRPSSPPLSPANAPGGSNAAALAEMYAKRTGGGTAVEVYPQSLSSSSSSSSSASSSSTASGPLLGGNTPYTRITVAELQERGFRTKAPLSKFNGTAATASLVRQEYSSAQPLPLVCASLEALANVTGLQTLAANPSKEGLQRRVLEATKSVTFSLSHAAAYAPSSAAAAVSSSSPGAGAAGGAGGAGGSGSPASPLPPSSANASPNGSPSGLGGAGAGGAAMTVDLSSIPQENLLAAAAGVAPPSASAASSSPSSSSAMAVDGEGGGQQEQSQPLVGEALTDRNLSRPFRFMFTTLKEKQENLEGRMSELSEAMLGAGVLDPALADLLVPVGTVSPMPIVCVGRVCTASDGGVLDGKINATSVLLEGPASDAVLTGIQRMALDLSELPGWSLFPGQIIAVKGTNPLGDKMRVSALYHGLPAPPAVMPAANRLAIAEAASSKGAGPLRMWVASGPYCLWHELDFSPFDDLMAEVNGAAAPIEDGAPITVPQVLVLMGPFVDADHPAVKSGELYYPTEDGGSDVLLTPRQVWEQKFLQRLEEYLVLDELSSLEVVLMPSWQDFNSMPVYPQAPFTADWLNAITDESVRRRVHLVSNPATFAVGDVIIAATSTDVLGNLLRDETTRMNGDAPGGGPRTDKLPRMAQHVLEQRCFFPLFPAPGPKEGVALPSEPSGFGTADAAVPLELSQLWSLGLSCSPDILILPSKLKGFARALGHTIAINPGNLCKGSIAGSFAKITIQRPTKEVIAKHSVSIVPAGSNSASAGATETYSASGILDRARVEVVRI